MATGRLRKWYWRFVQDPNNPVDQAARRGALQSYAAVETFGRGSKLVGGRILAFILSIVIALGITLLVGLISPEFIDGNWPNRALMLSVFIASTFALLGWFVTAPTVGVTFGRFRVVIVAEFFAFGVVGVLVAVGNFYDLFS